MPTNASAARASGSAPIDLNQREVLRLVHDLGLEGREARRHRGALVLDPVPEPREPLGAVDEDRVDDVRDVALPGAKRLILARRELEIGDVLGAQAAPDLLLGRDRLRLVDASPDEVEERRSPLVRPRLASLAQQDGDEGGLRVGRRLLLVLAVVARLELTAEERPDGHDHDEGGKRREREDDERRAQRAVERGRRCAPGRARTTRRRRARPARCGRAPCRA